MIVATPFVRTAMFAGGAALLLALLLTPLAAAAARRLGVVAKARSDRWHSKPTPLLGGVAIAVSVIGAMLLFVPLSRDHLAVLTGSAAMFATGIVDDFVRVRPYQKFICQLVCAAIVVSFGLVLPWTPYSTVNLLITLVWLVGITNAVNMLDNMDGLAAGVSAIAALSLAVNFIENRQASQALMVVALVGGLLGFLVYNRHPASIFMGDSGSMFIGFLLASMSLVSGAGGRSRSIVAVLAVPVLVLLVPIFDTTFVTLVRTLAGRAPSQGGRDHTSHRLVALGLSERDAVRMLYTFAAAGGVLAVLVRHASLDLSLGAIAATAVVLTFAGIHLAHVRVYDENARPSAIFSFLVDLSYKRRLFEIALDVMLIVLSYYFANVLVFGPASNGAGWSAFFKSLPVVLALQLAALLANGVYRGIWRYASVADLVRYARGVITGVAATVAYMAMFVSQRVPGPVFIIDLLLLMVALTASRLSFRVVRKLLPQAHATGTLRVVIYGAGDGGELMLRELRHNARLGRTPVAFIDDDPRKAGRLLNGLPVVAPNGPGSIAALCRAHGAEELLLSTSKLPVARVQRAADECRAAGVAVGRMTVEISALSPDDPA